MEKPITLFSRFCVRRKDSQALHQQDYNKGLTSISNKFSLSGQRYDESDIHLVFTVEVKLGEIQEHLDLQRVWVHPETMVDEYA